MAFDRISHEVIEEFLWRHSVPDQLVPAVMSKHVDTEFCAEQTKVQSPWTWQERGITQGYPLSPYLVLIGMSAMWFDIMIAALGGLIFRGVAVCGQHCGKHGLGGVDEVEPKQM